MDGEQGCDPLYGAPLRRVHIHPQQVFVGELVQKALIRGDIAVVAVGIVEKGTDAPSGDHGGIPFAMTDANASAVRRVARVLAAIARSSRTLARSRRHA